MPCTTYAAAINARRGDINGHVFCNEPSFFGVGTRHDLLDTVAQGASSSASSSSSAFLGLLPQTCRWVLEIKSIVLIKSAPQLLCQRSSLGPMLCPRVLVQGGRTAEHALGTVGLFHTTGSRQCATASGGTGGRTAEHALGPVSLFHTTGCRQCRHDSFRRYRGAELTDHVRAVVSV